MTDNVRNLATTVTPEQLEAKAQSIREQEDKMFREELAKFITAHGRVLHFQGVFLSSDGKHVPIIQYPKVKKVDDD